MGRAGDLPWGPPTPCMLTIQSSTGGVLQRRAQQLLRHQAGWYAAQVYHACERQTMLLEFGGLPQQGAIQRALHPHWCLKSVQWQVTLGPQCCVVVQTNNRSEGTYCSRPKCSTTAFLSFDLQCEAEANSGRCSEGALQRGAHSKRPATQRIFV